MLSGAAFNLQVIGYGAGTEGILSRAAVAMGSLTRF